MEEHQADYDEDLREAELYDNSRDLAYSLTRFLTKKYDYFRKRITGVMKEEYLPYSCVILLRGSIHRYKSCSLLESFLPVAKLDQRADRFLNAVIENLTNKGDITTNAEFLRFCALYILLAIDLKEQAGFDEAPGVVIEGICEAILQSKQHKYVHLWFFTPRHNN